MNYRFLCSNISMFTTFSFIMPIDYYARNIFMLGNRRPSTFLYSFFWGHQHFYTQACRFLCSKTFLCLYPYVSMLVSLCLYAWKSFIWSCPYVSMLLQIYELKNLRKIFTMYLKLCIKMSGTLWWKPFLSWIFDWRIIVKKTKIKRWGLQACMCQVAGACMRQVVAA